MSRQASLGESIPRVVYLMIPVRIDGDHLEVDLTDDGDPPSGMTTWVEDASAGPEGGYWEADVSEDVYLRAWDWLVNETGINEISTT